MKQETLLAEERLGLAICEITLTSITVVIVTDDGTTEPMDRMLNRQ